MSFFISKELNRHVQKFNSFKKIFLDSIDGLMSENEGLKKAMETLQAAVIAEQPGAMFWARD